MHRLNRVIAFLVVLAMALGARGALRAQQPPSPSEPVQKLGDHLFRLGQIRIDTAAGEIAVPGRINPVSTLEFVANTRGGVKAYESAITLDTDGIDFNVALLLIGLDVTHSRAPRRHFDPMVPEGDRVAMTIEWIRGAEHVRMPAEQLLFDRIIRQTLPAGAWVYTGSAILPDGRYLANVDGVLIGFVHSPAPIIEHASGAGVNRYGEIVLNPNLGLEADTPVTLTVKAVGAASHQRQ
jgi:hypothetical protein